VTGTIPLLENYFTQSISDRNSILQRASAYDSKHKHTIPSHLIGLGSIRQRFEQQDTDLLDVLRRSHVAHRYVSGVPYCVCGTGGCSRDKLHDGAEVVVPRIAFQHREPQCLVCIVEEIHALLHFPGMRKRCTSSIISQRTW